MNWWSEFADRILCNVPLGRRTWFRLGGCARYLFRPRDAADLAQLTRRARQEDVDVRILGCGANVLVLDDGFDGVVVRLDHPAFQSVDWFGHEVVVGAGVELMSFSKSCSSMGWSGLEGMAGIPATIGGAVRMNAGGRWGDFGDVVKEVAVLNEDGIEETWNRDRIGFAYRKTNLGRAVVLSARLSLNKDDPERTLERYKDYFLRKRETQPLVERSAGCIFKNPSGQAAGALIDQAGLKGTRVGGAAVSKRHANFIVADSAARSSDVVRLIDLIRDRIRNLFGLTLETEIDIWSSRDRQSVN